MVSQQNFSSVLTFKAYQELNVPPGLTFNNSTWWLHSVYVFSEQTVTFVLYNIKSWFLWPRWRLFTARYGISAYVTQIRFFFKGLNVSITTKHFGTFYRVLVVSKYRCIKKTWTRLWSTCTPTSHVTPKTNLLSQSTWKLNVDFT
jgi:hypothetical protein